MEFLKAANLAIVFALELCMLAALGYWGFNLPAYTVVKTICGIGAPLAAIVLWSIFAAPLSQHRLGQPGLAVFQLTLFAIAAATLYISGQRLLGVIFIAIAAASITLAVVWKQ